MIRSATALLASTTLVVGFPPGAIALDTYHGSIKRDGTQIALGQEVQMVGSSEFKKQKVRGKKRKVTVPVAIPVTVRVDSFGINDPRGACVGTVEYPNYCDDFVGGYIPNYAAQISVSNASTKQVDGISVSIVCSDTSSSNVAYYPASQLMPARTAERTTAVLTLPWGKKDPAACGDPLLVLDSNHSIAGKQGKPVRPELVYIPLSGIPLQ